MKHALIVVDYQRDFVTGTLGFPEAAALAEPIAAKIATYHQNGDDVLFTMDTHSSDYLQTQEGRNLPISHCIKGTPGHTLEETIAQQILPSDRFFEKNTFGSAALFSFLQKQSYQQIELVGVVSSICVLSNAILCKTALPEVPIFIDAACIAAPNPYLQKATLDILKNLQVQIHSASEA